MTRIGAAALLRDRSGIATPLPSIMVGTMGDKEQKRKENGGGSTALGPTSGEEGAERAFDLWLQRGLHRLYDDVAKEPLPSELLDLIQTDRTKRTK
jgi:hypothetical protein